MAKKKVLKAKSGKKNAVQKKRSKSGPKAKAKPSSKVKSKAAPVSPKPIKREKKPIPLRPVEKKPFVLKSYHYYIIYIFGFLLLAVAVFIFINNILAAQPSQNHVVMPAREISLEPVGEPGNLTVEELQTLLDNSGKLDLLPEGHNVQIYFYDDAGVSEPDLYFSVKNGTVYAGRDNEYELALSTNSRNIGELKKSSNFCLVMESIYLRDRDIRVEYGISKLSAFTKYGSFASSCMPSVMQVTGFSVMQSKPEARNTFYWYCMLLITIVLGIRLYIDLIKSGF